MSETTPNPRRRRWPMGLIGMLALVAAAERYVGRHDRDFTTVWASAWKKAGEAARGESARADVLCFGDSLVKHGVLPGVLAPRLGRSVYNLAVFNGQAPTSYFLLRRALRSGARPSAVLLDGEVLEYNPRDHARLWADLCTLGECFELAASAHDAGFFGSIALAHVVPSVRDRFEIRANVLAALRGQTSTSRYELIRHWRNWTVNRGAQVNPSEPHVPRVLLDQMEQVNYLPTTWTCDPLNAIYVKKFLRLAATHDIPVYWLLPPIHADVQARRERGGRDGVFVDFVRRLHGRFPNLTVIDGRHARYRDEAMFDLTHLNARGAAHLSADLGDILRTRLGGAERSPSRWVELPGYRDRPIDAPVEDILQSQLAIREQYASRQR